MPRLDRRQFLTSGLATAALWPSMGSVRAARFDSDPFTLGVASGCPRPDSVVLWTRLILPTDPLEVSADPFAPIDTVQQPPIDVAWDVADDSGFGSIVASGVARATATLAHSVHVTVTGLRPDRWYFYRFRAGDALSPVGRTRTAPAVDAANTRFSLAFASCQQYEQGYYSAYRDMAERDLDLVVHLGDYIYERSYGANLVRRHGSGIPTLLYEYRDRHALYRSDPDLQRAHARFPWLVVWDDHEVVNNYGRDRSQDDVDPASFLKRRAAAYQAWYEHMPVPPQAAPRFDDLRIYGHFSFGQLLTLTLLDTRQYRSPASALDNRAAASGQTLLGARQERWFRDAMRKADGQWSVIGQPTLLSERDTASGPNTSYNLDGWDGYRAARAHLLDTVLEARVDNPIVLGGDLHAFYAADVKTDFGATNAPVIATEFVTGSITSNGPSKTSTQTALAENPHLKFIDGEAHGYGMVHFTPDQTRTDFVAVSDRKDPDATARVRQSFAVLPGMPGVNRI
jgi:alkaline phosphatase D